MRYRIALDLPAMPPFRPPSAEREGKPCRVTGDLFIDASPGRALPPLTIRGAGGWVSGYVVPVMSGRLNGG